jgi:hypothetical protein
MDLISGYTGEERRDLGVPDGCISVRYRGGTSLDALKNQCGRPFALISAACLLVQSHSTGQLRDMQRDYTRWLIECKAGVASAYNRVIAEHASVAASVQDQKLDDQKFDDSDSNR